jgi:hypothetical protein
MNEYFFTMFSPLSLSAAFSSNAYLIDEHASYLEWGGKE